MADPESPRLEDFFEGRTPTHAEIMHKLRAGGEFMSFAVGKFFESEPIEDDDPENPKPVITAEEALARAYQQSFEEE